jgi:hypothetical protein
MKRQQKLTIAFGTLVLVSLGFSTLTFAWINYTQNIAAVKVESGSLTLSDLSTTTYKYVYPYFEGSTVFNYFGDGTVTSYPDAEVAMNIYDPTYLTITDNASQAGISLLNTTLVISLSFSLKYSTSVDFSITIRKDAYTPADSQHLGICQYLRFNSFYYASAEAYAAAVATYAPTKTSDADKAFYTIKGAAEASSDSKSLGSSVSTLAISETALVSERPNVETTSTFTFYLAIDYSYLNTSEGGVTDFYDGTHLGNHYTLDDDYTISIAAAQGAL